MTFRHCVAVDLGASSGRVMLATGTATCTPLRFAKCTVSPIVCKNRTVLLRDIDARKQRSAPDFTTSAKTVFASTVSALIPGVDYVLLDRHGERVGLPVSYRDSRTDGLMAHAIAQLGKENIYGRSGIQFLPFNTLYQLRALVEQQPELVEKVAHALLIPDYLSYRLTGNMNWEYTNATTTQLVNINTDNWDEHLLAGRAPRRLVWRANPSGQCDRPLALPAGE